MNTLEVKPKGIIRSFSDLYRYANKQFLEYEKLEGISDWEEYGFSIDCSEDQMKFKDMLQIRFIEELTEATHCLDDKDHFYEEMTDAMNFFLSAYCMLGIDMNELKNPEMILRNSRDIDLNENNGGIYIFFYELVNKTGYLCNLLKNRPWAQSNYLVSMVDFKERYESLWEEFWKTMSFLGFTKEMLFDMFERKYLVNKWRIRTGY